MREAQVAALWQGFVHGEGTGCDGKVELALPFSLVWAGRGIKTFTATGDLPVVEGEPSCSRSGSAPTATGPTTRRTSCVGDLKPEYAELETALMDVYDSALEHIRPGAPMAELDRQVREQLHDAGYAGQPTHPICHGVGARAHEPPYPHQAGGGEFEEGMVLAVEPGVYWAGGGGLRVEDNFLVTSDGVEKLSLVPGRSGAMSDLIWTGTLNDRYAIRGEVGLYDTTLRDGEQTVGVVSRPRRSSRSRGCSTGSGSGGSRRASRGCRRTTGGPSS